MYSKSEHCGEMYVVYGMASQCGKVLKNDHTKKFPWNQLFSNFSRWVDEKNPDFSIKMVIVF